jgi:hypothetical protein
MLRSEITSTLKSFTPISLAEMDEVTLMNRVETKYVFSSDKLPNLLDLLSRNYRVLEIEGVRDFSYHTTYLDTPDYLLLNQHLRGKLNRHKVRYRCYEASGLTFLEIKKKTNKNRTIKWRIKNRQAESFDNAATKFLKEYFPHSTGNLKPVLLNDFLRITLVGIDVKERITLDSNISFGNPEGKIIGLPFLAIAEIKRERHSGNSPICNIMKALCIQPNGFSKYSMGSSLIREMPRINTLKSKILLLNKIENEYIKSA